MPPKSNYTEEFKTESVNMVLDGDTSIYQIAKNLGIKYKTLHRWVQNAMPETNNTQSGKSRIKSLETEVRTLKQQLKRTKQERDILKKAAAYFASQKL